MVTEKEVQLLKKNSHIALEVNDLIETLERAIAIMETFIRGGVLPENPVEFLKAYKEV